MTQLESARKGIVTPEMIRVAQRECVMPEFIRNGVALTDHISLNSLLGEISR